MVSYTALQQLFKSAGMILPNTFTPATLIAAGGNAFAIEGLGLLTMIALERTGLNNVVRGTVNGTLETVHTILDKTFVYDKFTMFSDFVVDRLNLSDGEKEDHKQFINLYMRVENYKLSEADILVIELATLQAGVVGNATKNPKYALAAFAFFSVIYNQQKKKLLREGKEPTIANLVKAVPGNNGVANLVKFFEGQNELNYTDDPFGDSDNYPNFNEIKDSDNVEGFRDGFNMEDDGTLDFLDFSFSFEDLNNGFEPLFEEDHFTGLIDNSGNEPLINEDYFEPLIDEDHFEPIFGY